MPDRDDPDDVEFNPDTGQEEEQNAEAVGDDLLDAELDALDAGQTEDFRQPTKPAVKPVDGEDLFDGLVELFSTFMILPEGAAELLSLWVVASYALHVSALPFAVRIVITAPGPNSGKTTLLELLTYLVRRPEPASDLTDASFFRIGVVVAPPVVAASRPGSPSTLLIDECDRLLPSRESRHPIVQKLNAGHRKTTAVVTRVETVDKVRVPVRYSVFFPVCMAGIGDFAPVTIKLRSFIIKLKPKMPNEHVEKFIADEHAPLFRTLREDILRWVLDHKDAIREARPTLDPDLYNNRSADNAATLLMIAETLGANCAKQARAAIKALTRGDIIDANGMLLGDIASMLTDPEIKVGDPPAPVGDKDFLLSSDLCALLREHFPHRELYAGFTQAKLASMLSNFDIEPAQKRHGTQVLRGYRRAPFDEWMVRYGFMDAGVAQTAEATDIGLADMVEKAATPTPDAPSAEMERRNPPSDDLVPIVAKGEVGVALDGATLLPEEPNIDGEPAAAPTASAADATDGSRSLQAGVPDQEPAPQTSSSKIVYGAAHVVEPGKGDKKRGARLRVAVDAVIQDGGAEPDNVEFISARFWVIQRDGKPCFVHLNGHGLEWCPIGRAGLLAEEGVVRINSEKSLPLADGDFVMVRRLVNTYRKTANSAVKPR